VFGTGASTYTASAQQYGNGVSGGLGPSQKTFTEEFQVHGDAREAGLVWNLGGFYQYQPGLKNLDGVANLYRIYSGTLTPNLGYSAAYGFQDGGHAQESAAYGQVTFDLGKIRLDGWRLTGGYRQSWSQQSQTTIATTVSYPSGLFTPSVVSGAATTTSASSSGYNYTVSLDGQLTSHLLAYVTTRRGYVPGGVNAVVGGSDLPNFTPTYAPETVQDVEVGVKSDFHVADARVRLDVSYYHDSFSNIQRQFTAQVGAQSVVYNENVAAAALQGVEVQASVVGLHGWSVSATYSYSDAHYTKWIGQDPFNQASAGDSACVSSSPAGGCLLDLSDNPFVFAPAHKGSVTVSYRLPLPEDVGEVKVSLTGYAQSREYLMEGANRALQLLPGYRDAVSQAPFATLNARLDWKNIRGSRWTASAFVNNVTDETYALTGIPQLFTLGVATKIYAPPRMFGVGFSYAFGN
jgi:iron complex outermembrane recepter protein